MGMTMAKMLVVNAAEDARDLQSKLGDGWYVTTYQRGRIGQRVDTILFCEPRSGATEAERQLVMEARLTLLHALVPGGSWAVLP